MISEILDKLFVWKYRRYILGQVADGMQLGKNVAIMPGAQFDPPHSFLIKIGDNCTIAPAVRFLCHDASLGKYGGMARLGRITIEENCFIGANSLILPNVKIGANSIVAAGSVVAKDVPANSIVGGNPAKIIRDVDGYVEKNKEIVAENPQLVYHCDEFYSKINDESHREKVRGQLEGTVGYTLGGGGSDGDFRFFFNRD